MTTEAAQERQTGRKRGRGQIKQKNEKSFAIRSRKEQTRRQLFFPSLFACLFDFAVFSLCWVMRKSEMKNVFRFCTNINPRQSRKLKLIELDMDIICESFREKLQYNTRRTQRYEYYMSPREAFTTPHETLQLLSSTPPTTRLRAP